MIAAPFLVRVWLAEAEVLDSFIGRGLAVLAVAVAVILCAGVAVARARYDGEVDL